VTGTPIWPIEERPVPKSEMHGEQSWPTQPFPTRPPPFSKQSFTEADINPHPMVSDAAREAFKQRLKATRNMGLFTPIDLVDTLHIPGSNGGALFGYTASEPTTGMVYVIGQDNPGVLKLLPPKPGGPGTFPGQAVYTRECQACHAPDRSGTENGPTLTTLTGRVSPADIRATIANGKGRMPAFPHINDVDMDALIAFLTAPIPGGGRGRGAGPAITYPPGPVVASGGAQTRPGGRGRGFGPRPYPEGVEQRPQYVIDAYGTIGIMMKPPFTTLTKYDLNQGTILWQVGLGDDARLAALGVTGTGVTQMRSSLIVTAAGLIFAPGGDSKVRAYDADTGKVLWTTSLGGNIRGGPSMYEMDGRQYLLVAAAGDILPSGLPPDGKPPTGLPSGYVAYALKK
jgi:quinoprotein glucose dehydrogenase